MVKPLSTAERRQQIISAPIGKQLFKLTIPMLYALIAIMGLGVVDSYFISFLGTTELAAIALIIPITAVVTSVGLGLGMAISSLNSKLIGANSIGTAARLITDGYLLTALVSAIVVSGLASTLEPIFSLLGATESTLPHILEYMRIWLFAAPLTMFVMVSASTFRSLGDTRRSAQISIMMTLSNMLLDPILIYGFEPIPAMGMGGAALATFLATLLALTFALYHLGFSEKLLIPKLPTATEFRQNFSQLLHIAVPAILANCIVPLSSAVLIRLVANFGTAAVAGYGVGMRVEAVSLMVVYALSSTLPMFIGQNLGAGRNDRVIEATKLAFRFVLMLQLGIYIALVFLAPWIAELFSDQPEVRNSIRSFLWILPVCYGAGGVVILVNVAMNVLGKPRTALYINLVRYSLLYFPLAWLGGRLFDLEGLLAGVALGTFLAYLMAAKILKRTFTTLGISAAPKN